MGFIKPKGIIMCQKCGQLHGVDYVCSGRKGPQPVKSEFPRLVRSKEHRGRKAVHRDAPDPVKIAAKVWEDVLDEKEPSAVEKIRNRFMENYVAEKEILELGPGQEIGLRMELGDVTLLRMVGGVQIILEIRGGQSFSLTHEQFTQILDHGLNGAPADGWSILLALCSLSVLLLSFFVFFM